MFICDNCDHHTLPRESATRIKNNKICYSCAGRHEDLVILKEQIKRKKNARHMLWLKLASSGSPVEKHFDDTLVWQSKHKEEWAEYSD